jgi:hypothetical protein
MSEPSDKQPLDLRERSVERDGQPQVLDTRLFMQLLVFECGGELSPKKASKQLRHLLTESGLSGVVYEDVNHPAGLGLVTWSQDPAHFVVAVRAALQDLIEAGLRVRPEFTMLGRTYASGFEADLEHWLLRRPVETVTNAAWPWAVWYPLRRGGAFEKLEPREKGMIMREHGTIGKSYGEADLAHDVRLACHGLDANDNEFVIGLVGAQLFPLSHIVQSMRRTRQTSEFITQMGPFFVGHAVLQVP